MFQFDDVIMKKTTGQSHGSSCSSPLSPHDPRHMYSIDFVLTGKLWVYILVTVGKSSPVKTENSMHDGHNERLYDDDNHKNT